jgi:hypothetical protein
LFLNPLPLVSQLARAIKADTGLLIEYMDHFNERLDQVLENIHVLQISKEDPQREGGAPRQKSDDDYMLWRYLDTISNYAETVCGDRPRGDTNSWEEEQADFQTRRPTTIRLEDTQGRTYAIPFEDCKDWEVRGALSVSHIRDQTKA